MAKANRNSVPPGRDLRLKRLLARAAKEPSVVLEDRRFLKPYACEAYFEICDDKALREPAASLEYASTAVRLAEKIGDRHLMNQAQGVLVHAHIANKKWLEAEEILAGYHERANGCCAACQSEFFRRRGDLLVETRRPSKALDDLIRSVEDLEPGLDADRYARVRFVRGIAYHFDEDPGRALDDAGRALLDLSFDSPRGYFLDALAFIGCFLQGAEPRHFEQARDYLDRFRERLKGVKDWTDVRERLIWVEGGVYARLGDSRAAERLTSSRRTLFKSGPVKYALAAAADEGMFIARKLDERSLVALRTLISKCQGLDLDEELKRRVAKVEDVLVRNPERAFTAFAALRRRLIVPVPGLL